MIAALRRLRHRVPREVRTAWFVLLTLAGLLAPFVLGPLLRHRH